MHVLVVENSCRIHLILVLSHYPCLFKKMKIRIYWDLILWIFLNICKTFVETVNAIFGNPEL